MSRIVTSTWHPWTGSNGKQEKRRLPAWAPSLDYRYRPSTKPTMALERLLDELEVPRESCHPMEKAGFTLLLKKGFVREEWNCRGHVYRTPNFRTQDERKRWWAWADRHYPDQGDK